MLNRRTTGAGLLLYRTIGRRVEIFLGHPGSPYSRLREDDVWTLPKGKCREAEDLREAACREFIEETGIVPSGPFLALGHIRQGGGKRVHAWAWRGDAAPGLCASRMSRTEWPRNSGVFNVHPELDRFGWFDTGLARRKLISAQRKFIDRLEAALRHDRLTATQIIER